jgi:rod shape determining protein RodA
MKLLEKRMFRKFDYFSMAIVLAIFLFGLVTLMNATAQPFSGDEYGFSEIVEKLDLHTVMLQFIWFLVGVAGMFALIILDYSTYGELYRIIYWGGVALLLAVLFLGRVIRGTQGWFQIGSRGFQPAEFVKIALIIVLAKVASNRSDPARGVTTFKEALPILGYLILPVALVMSQPDWGTAFVYIVICAGILLAARISLKMVGILLAIAIPIAFLLYFFLMADWQFSRILSFLNPEADALGAGMQVVRSKEVIASGGMTGKGLFAESTLSQLGYLPDHQTDFIFAVVVETFGWTGGLYLILLYAALLIRLIILSFSANDRFGSFIIIGVMSMYAFHIIENIGMVCGVLPVTGIPLPFVSYGGSNMLTNMLALGLVQNVAMRRMPRQKRRFYVDPSERAADMTT